MIKPVYVLLVETQVQNTVGTDLFGQYFFHLNFVYLFQFLGDFGLQTWNNQYVSKNREGTSSFLASVVTVKIILSFLWVITTMITSLFFEGLQWSWVLMITFNLLLSSWFLLLRSFLSGLGKYSLDSWLSSLDKLLMIFIVYVMLYYHNKTGSFTVFHFITAQTISLFVAFLIAGLFVLKNLSNIHVHVDFAKIKTIVKACVPYAVVLFLTMAYQKLDGFFLGAFVDDNGTQAGIYAAAYRIYDAANMFLYIIPTLVLPMFSYMIAGNHEISEFYSIVVRWVFLLLGPILTVCLIFTENILGWLYLAHITEKSIVLQWLILSSILISFAYLFGALSMALDKVQTLIPVFIAGLVINVLLLWVLVPMEGAKGAAMATFCTQICVFVGQWWVIRKLIYLNLSIIVVVKGMLYWISLFIVAWLLKQSSQLSVPVAIGTSIIISLPLALFFKILSFADIQNILTNRKKVVE